MHSSTKSKSHSEATSISFSLSDADKGDEFVVDVSFDKKYGTVVFDTISGLSKCPHEDGTKENERPVLKMNPVPTNPAFPNAPVLFDIQLGNDGKGKSSTFNLSASRGQDNLGIMVDGSNLGSGGLPFTVKSSEPAIWKQVAVTRGPSYFRNDAVKLTLESTW